MKTQVLNEKTSGKTIFTSGFLPQGELINGYSVESKLETDSGEAEIYHVTKDGKRFILKYYFTVKPKTQVLKKLQKISSDGVLQLVDFGEYKDRFYSIIEYAEGGSLDARNDGGKYVYLPVSETEAMNIVRQVVEGFNVCHKAGIIHRDIKPGNLFYADKACTKIKIGDFGISSSFDADDGMSKHLTQTTDHSEGYAAPESFSEVIGPELDYYSLGVTLWEILTGKNPCEDANGKPMITEQIYNDTVSGKMLETLLSRAPELSPKMRTMISGLMTRRHDKRWNYDSVTKFLNGGKVAVFKEATQIGTFMIGNVECHTFKEIAKQLLKDKAFAKEYIYKFRLNRELAKIDRKLADKIADIADKYSAENKLDEGITAIAYALCPNMGFDLTEKISIETYDDLLKLMKDRPDIVLPFLKDQKSGLFDYLKNIGAEKISDAMKDIIENTTDEYLIIPKILVSMKDNKIQPFADKDNKDLVLSLSGDLSEKLSPELKKRFLMTLDAENKEAQAWLENVTGKNFSDWKELYSQVSDSGALPENGEEALFQIFFLPEYYQTDDAKDLTEILKKLKDAKEYALVNRLVENVLPVYERMNACKAITNILVLIRKNHMECLSRSFGNYMYVLGDAFYKQNMVYEAGGYLELSYKLDKRLYNDAQFWEKYSRELVSRHLYGDAKTVSEYIQKVKTISQFVDANAEDLYKKGNSFIFQTNPDYAEAVRYYTMAIETAGKPVREYHQARLNSLNEMKKITGKLPDNFKEMVSKDEAALR